MSFLFPAMLAGLAGLAIPMVIHLIARHEYPVQNFPATHLLERDERANVFQLRLVDVWQLLLRLLVLALLVLLMARLFAPGGTSYPAPRNLVLLIDCSASMRMEVAGPDAAETPGDGDQSARKPMIELAKAKAKELLAEISKPSQCALVTAGARTEVLAPLRPDPGKAISEIENIRAGDGTGPGLIEGLAKCCEIVRRRREVKSQIVVLTDMRAGAFETRNQLDLQRIAQTRDDIGHSLDIAFVDLSGGEVQNLAIIDAYVRGGTVTVGEDAHVVAKVVNYSDEAGKATMRLAVGKAGQGEPRRLDFPPNGRTDVVVPVRASRASQMFLQVSAEAEDAMPYDNVFDVPLVISEERHVLLVNGAAPAESMPDTSAVAKLSAAAEDDGQLAEEETIDGAKILKLALNPSREVGFGGGTGIRTTMITPDVLPQQTLSKYDMIILYDVSTVSDKAWDDLHRFVSDGQALLIVCSGETNAPAFNKVIALARPDPDAGADAKPRLLCPVELGNDKLFSPPVAIDLAGRAHPVLEAFSDRLQGDLSVIRFTKLRELRRLMDGATTMMKGTGGVPLIVEMAVGRGKVALTTFGPELNRGNIARTRAFLPLMWRLVRYLTGTLKARAPDVLAADQPAVLGVSESQFALAPELELVSAGQPEPGDDDGEPREVEAIEPRRLEVTEGGTVFLEQMRAGRYVLRKPGRAKTFGYARNIAVNPSTKESQMDRLPAEGVREMFGPGARVVDAAEGVGPPPGGLEFASLLVVLLVLMYAAEAAIGFLLSAKRERQRGRREG